MHVAAKQTEALLSGPRDPVHRADNLLASLRYTNPYAWFEGFNDGRRGYPASHEHGGGRETYENEAGYEKLVREHFYQLMLRSRVPVVAARKRLEAMRQLALRAKAELNVLYGDKKEEYGEAAAAFMESHRKYGFKAWTPGRVVRRALLFAFELPLNFLAFLGHGDSPAMTAATVLGVSVIIPVGSHFAGKLLKQAAEGAGGKNTKRVGVAFLLMLAGVVACVAIFRMNAFVQLARTHREISDSSGYVIAAFYALLQMIFISVGTVESYSCTKPTDEIEALQLKFDKPRYMAAKSDMEQVRRARERADQTLIQVEVEMSRLSELEALEMRRLESRCRELIGVYRKSNLRRRKEGASPAPDSWLRGGPVLWEFSREPLAEAKNSVVDHGDDNNNNNHNGNHRERASARVKL